MRVKPFRVVMLMLACFFITVAWCQRGLAQQRTDNTPAEASSPAEADQQLAKLLLIKGVITQADYDHTFGAATVVSVSTTATSTANVIPAVYRVPVNNGSNSASLSSKPLDQGAAAPPQVIPAVAPLRVLPIDTPKREGIAPDFKIGNNIRLRPYGFFKATAIYDTSSPYGNDFPLPGFIGDTNGPDKIAEFHLKTRSLRFGTNFEWLDMAPNVVITGRFEVDFEGNFTRANNRNISSIRSSQPSIRLGYGRIDWHATDRTAVNFLAGQDWTLFASSTLPNLLESTQSGGFGFGNIFERQPQLRFGVNHNFGGFSIEPDFAVVLPAFGNLPSNVADQLGFGERQGADSGRPEVQARLVAQFQLDKSPGVAPAQIIFSGMQGERSAVVLASGVPTPAASTGLPANFFKAAFPTGARLTTNRAGYTVEVQLPTRFATLTAKYFRGSDLRYYFAGQLFAEFNDTAGFATFASTNGASMDGSSTLVFGAMGATCSNTNVGGCTPVVAPQRAPRSQGGFLNLGLPLSRWANANPSGRNAGWTLYLHYGYDAVFAPDVRRLGGGRMKGDLFSGQLQYKLNNWVTFAAEESLYRTRALRLTSTGLYPLFDGRPMREWNDIRTEIGPIFTF